MEIEETAVEMKVNKDRNPESPTESVRKVPSNKRKKL